MKWQPNERRSCRGTKNRRKYPTQDECPGHDSWRSIDRSTQEKHANQNQTRRNDKNCTDRTGDSDAKQASRNSTNSNHGNGNWYRPSERTCQDLPSSEWIHDTTRCRG